MHHTGMFVGFALRIFSWAEGGNAMVRLLAVVVGLLMTACCLCVGEAGEAALRHSVGQVMKPWPVEVHDEGGVLLFSDSPEYVKDHGILYSDVVKGQARVFYYHVNVSPRPGKLAVVLENLESKPAHVTISRSALPEPSENYFQVGKDTETIYMRMPQQERVVYLAPGGRKVMDPLMAVEWLLPQKLGAGMYDFNTQEKVRVSVVFCPSNVEPEDFVDTARVLPRDKEALRGTFKGMNRIIKAKKRYEPGKDGLAYIPIGDGRVDTFKHGVDATDGAAVVNYGNYGVLYRFEVPTKGKGQTRMMLSPLGGSYAGAVRVESGKREESMVHTPMGTMFFGEQTPGDLVAVPGTNILLTPDFELATIGSYRSYKKMAVEYSPPGASNLPALFILAPNSPRALGY